MLIRRRLIFLAFLFAGVVITFGIAACGDMLPATISIRADGVTEHIDTQDSPCGNSIGGCYHQRADGSQHIWRSVLSPSYVVRHEDAHALGMRHSEWRHEWGNRFCATVTAAGGKYAKGQTICVSQSGESIF